MGILILGVSLLAFVVGIVLGLLGFLLHLNASRKHGRGSWWLYSAIAVTVALAFLAGAAACFRFESGGGASDESAYLRVILAFALAGAAPGAGLLSGALAILHRP